MLIPEYLDHYSRGHPAARGPSSHLLPEPPCAREGWPQASQLQASPQSTRQLSGALARDPTFPHPSVLHTHVGEKGDAFHKHRRKVPNGFSGESGQPPHPSPALSLSVRISFQECSGSPGRVGLSALPPCAQDCHQEERNHILGVCVRVSVCLDKHLLGWWRLGV